MTKQIGPRSSSSHDAMTLLFIRPIQANGNNSAGYLCGRVPNDVIGDLIQRESGHIYPDSGDNYIFMAESNLNRLIKPGTALSRSRFEVRTFTHGENLKDGVTTKWVPFRSKSIQSWKFYSLTLRPGSCILAYRIRFAMAAISLWHSPVILFIGIFPSSERALPINCLTAPTDGA